MVYSWIWSYPGKERERFSRSIENVWNLKEKRLRPTQVFSCEFCEIFKTIVLQSTSERLLQKKNSPLQRNTSNFRIIDIKLSNKKFRYKDKTH